MYNVYFFFFFFLYYWLLLDFVYALLLFESMRELILKNIWGILTVT